MGWLLLAAAIAPALFLLHFVYVRDKYEREPLKQVLLVYFVSFFTVIPAVLWELNSPRWERFGLLGIAISCWGVIALAEESCKYLALKWLALRHPSFNEVYDGILYSVAASLGFATVENIGYVLGGGGMGLALLRALLSVPGHALWGVMMGYYLGRARFAPPAQKRRLVWTGLGLAIFWHGLYDFFAFGATATAAPLGTALALGVPLVILCNWIYALRLISRAQSESFFKRPPVMVNPVGALALAWRYCHRCGWRGDRSNTFCRNCGYEHPA